MYSNHHVYSHINGHEIVSANTCTLCVEILKFNVVGTSFTEFDYNTSCYFESSKARKKMILKILPRSLCILVCVVHFCLQGNSALCSLITQPKQFQYTTRKKAV